MSIYKFMFLLRILVFVIILLLAYPFISNITNKAMDKFGIGRQINSISNQAKKKIKDLKD
ncbi:MAG: hypothetical protein ACKO46_07175 [Alphaproteobacteria bacterium]